jgi:hypothetical protein
MLLAGPFRQAGEEIRKAAASYDCRLLHRPRIESGREGGLPTQLARFEGKQAYLVC